MEEKTQRRGEDGAGEEWRSRGGIEIGKAEEQVEGREYEAEKKKRR